MGYGCRHNDSIILERTDANGISNVLARRLSECGHLNPDDVDMPSYLAGAFNLLYVLETHEFRDQSEFFLLFDALTGGGYEQD